MEFDWRDLKKDMTVTGKGRFVLKKFGLFEGNWCRSPGLVHISVMAQGFLKS
jgi:predicted RNA-binding protein with RPS1 domain